MGAFIVGGIVFSLTLAVTIIMAIANRWNYGDTKYPTGQFFCAGIGIAAVIVGSHFVGW